MSSDPIRLREIDQAINAARRHILLLCEQKHDERRTRELSLKRMVLHREILANNPVLLTAIQPEVLQARLFP
jgi:hypothetical protein